jgi:hypothetical protein
MSKDSGLFFSTEVLRAHGCRGCVWKDTGECPEGFTEVDESTDDGYCDKLVRFLGSLAGDSGSVDVALEGFQLHVMSLDGVEDRVEVQRLRKLLLAARSSGASEEEVRKITMQIGAYKQWLLRLGDSVAKVRGKRNDRVARKDDNDRTVTHKLDLSQMHKLVNVEAKRLEENKDE